MHVCARFKASSTKLGAALEKVEARLKAQYANANTSQIKYPDAFYAHCSDPLQCPQLLLVGSDSNDRHSVNYVSVFLFGIVCLYMNIHAHFYICI